MRTINYDHIPHVNYFKKPVVNLLSLDIKIAGKKIGYIEGAGDNVPLALQQMGYEVTILTDYDLGNNDLSKYDAILTGVRAYNVKETLNTYYDKLMRYVEQGGNLVVQYNTSSQVGPVRAKIGPYPFNITRTRITDEKALVNVLKPDHKVMNFPNKITSKDFDGWIQERSIYHADNLDSHYETIFSMSDPGEKVDEGSLIIANYGKGKLRIYGTGIFPRIACGCTGCLQVIGQYNCIESKKGVLRYEVYQERNWFYSGDHCGTYHRQADKKGYRWDTDRPVLGICCRGIGKQPQKRQLIPLCPLCPSLCSLW
jgi:hypothetical protein